jgi:hypothetical protein
MATKKTVAKKSSVAWHKKDLKGPADTAKFLNVARKIVERKVNEFGFVPNAPRLGGVRPGPVHVRPRALQETALTKIGEKPKLPLGGGPGGGPGGGGPSCPVNVTKNSGAPILSAPKVYLMWWSTYFWDRHKTQRDFYKKALNAFCNDASFWSRMSEYGITGGSYGGSIDLTRFGGSSASVTEQTVQDTLTFRFNNLVSPPAANDIYVIMLPNGITSQYDTSQGFIGHHQTYQYKGQNIWYSVVEYSTDTNQTLSVITHEIYEAASDPDVSTGYFDHAQGGETEVGDLCNGQTTTMDGYTVQLVWSQKSCGCK